MCFEKPLLWWLLETHVASRRSWEEPSRQGSSLHRLISAKRMRAAGGARLQNTLVTHIFAYFLRRERHSPLSCQGCPVPLVVENNDAFSFLHRAT